MLCYYGYNTAQKGKGEDMLIEVDFNSDEAIYVQLCNQIILGIATSVIREGDSLPSVRQLADMIGVNMHTVNKAYSVLKREGYISLDKRRGAVISLDIDKMEQLGLISRSSDFVTSIVDVVSVQNGHAMGRAFTNPNRLLLAERNQTSPVLSPPAQSVQGADTATVIMKTSEKPQTDIITSSEATIPSKAAKMPQSLFDFADEDGTVVPYGQHE